MANCRKLGCVVVGLVWALAAPRAQADLAAANACAAGLSKDARTIFDATLPQVGPGVDLRAVVTSTTRHLAMSGTIARDTARGSATEAAGCLKRAQP